ncbi:MAG TPA: glycosyltransferase family 1 protein [Sphingomicrobium sp.]|nr:glycosyltransferase family 1 protein [Sphingomicrobium sp.]
MRIALATDAWQPQVNGVVRSLSATVERLHLRGHDVEVIHPGDFRTVPCPTYPEIRLAFGCAARVRGILDKMGADAIHVATEGPIGWAARSWCLRNGRRFTTSFHTRFPDYVSVRTGIPADWIWHVIRRFHNSAERTFAATATLADELETRRLGPVHRWPLGVDRKQFNPAVPPHPAVRDLPRPVHLYVGRVAVEKNIQAFLDCPVQGSKVVVGDGPALDALKQRYGGVHFLGPKHGAELASTYTAADVFVFPSRTDTFGLVNIEALACGLPVAAFPERGPLDILGPKGQGIHGGQRRIGAADHELSRAITRALSADRVAAAAEARHYDWDRCTDRFLEGLALENGTQGHFCARADHRRPDSVATGFLKRRNVRNGSKTDIE